MDVTNFFQQLMLGALGELEKERLAFTKKFSRRLWLTLLFVALLISGSYNFVPAYFIACIVSSIVIVIGLVIVLAVMYSRFRKELTTKFKQQVVPDLVKYVDQRLFYYPNLPMLDTYYESGIFTKSVDRYRAEDTVKGTFDKTEFAFGEIHTEYKTYYTDKNGNRHESWHTIFKGIIFVSEFQKNFAGETYLDADRLERSLGWLGRKFQRWNPTRKGDLIRMENPAFEKYFATYSDDEQEARYILSSSMMERMVKLRESLGVEVYFAFRNNQLYIAVFNNKDFFEPHVFGQVLREKACIEFVTMLQDMAGIVEDLNLNTRIWTKE